MVQALERREKVYEPVEKQTYFHSMKQHAVGYSHAIPNDALDANGDIWPNFAVFANLGSGMDNVISNKVAALSQLGCINIPQAGQVEAEPCNHPH